MRILAFFLLIIFPFPALGGVAYKHVSFEVLSQASGLNNNTVYAVHQDSCGQMWFLTDVGLSRYDGLRFHDFRAAPADSPRTRIFPLGGILVMPTVEGELTVFDTRRERYVDVKYDTVKGAKLGVGTCFVRGGDNRLYAANREGLFRVAVSYDDPAQENPVAMVRAEPLKDAPKGLGLISMDPKGRLYSHILGTAEILCYDTATGVQTRIDFSGAFGSGNVPPVIALFAFDDNLWISFHRAGAVNYDYASRRAIRLSAGTDHFPYLYDNHFFEVVRGPKDVYFVATQQGLFRFTFRGRPVENDCFVEIAPPAEGLFRALIEPQTLSVAFDPVRNVLWSGTFGGGVVKYNMNVLFYSQMLLDGMVVNHVTQDTRGYVWVATQGDGLLRGDRPGMDRNIRFGPVAGTATEDNNFVIFNDADANMLWFGDRRGNLIRVNQQTQEVDRQQVVLQDGTVCRDRINRIYVGSRKRLWVAMGRGLFYRIPGESFFRKVDMPEKFHSYGVTAIIEGSDGAIWVGTESGLWCMILRDGRFHMTSGYEKQAGEVPSMVYTLYVNSKGQLIATYADKLIRINPSSTDHKRVDKAFALNRNDGLDNGHITCLADDRLGNTWIGTNAGILVNKSGGRYFFTFAYSGTSRDVCRLNDGRLLWANSLGLLYFDPYAVQEFAKSDRMVLSDVNMDHHNLMVGERVDGRVVLPEAPYLKTSLTLPKRKEGDVTLFFSDVHYSVLPKRLVWRLEPETDRWDTVDIVKGIVLPELSAGDYKLQVRSLYYDDSSSDIHTWNIYIRPPWYATGWARVAYILLAALLFLGGLKWMRRYVDAIRQRYVRMVLRSYATKYTIPEEPEDTPVRTILIIGDTSLHRLLDVLLKDECQFLHVIHGTEGVFAAMRIRPDVIVCGSELDDMDGYECVRRLKENPRVKSVPVVMLDSGFAEEDKLRALEAGAEDYLSTAELPEIIRSKLMNLMNRPVADMASRAEESADEQGDDFLSPDELFGQRVIRTIEEHVDEPNFSVRRLAEIMGMSQSTLYRKVMQSTHSTILELIRDVRLNRSAQLLLEQKYTVQSIAEMVGYSDVATFRRHFANLFGMTPSQYVRKVAERQMHQENEKREQ